MQRVYRFYQSLSLKLKRFVSFYKLSSYLQDTLDLDSLQSRQHRLLVNELYKQENHKKVSVLLPHSLLFHELTCFLHIYSYSTFLSAYLSY